MQQLLTVHAGPRNHPGYVLLRRVCYAAAFALGLAALGLAGVGGSAGEDLQLPPADTPCSPQLLEDGELVAAAVTDRRGGDPQPYEQPQTTCAYCYPGQPDQDAPSD